MPTQRILRLIEDHNPTHQEGGNLAAPKLFASDLYLEVAPPSPSSTGFVPIRLLAAPGSTVRLVPEHLVVVAGLGLYRVRRRVEQRRRGVVISIRKGELVEVVQAGGNHLRDYFHPFAPYRPWSIKQLNHSNPQLITLDPKFLEPFDHPLSSTISLTPTLAALLGPVAGIASAVTELPPGYEGLEEEEEGGGDVAGDATRERTEDEDTGESGDAAVPPRYHREGSGGDRDADTLPADTPVRDDRDRFVRGSAHGMLLDW